MQPSKSRNVTYLCALLVTIVGSTYLVTYSHFHSQIHRFLPSNSSSSSAHNSLLFSAPNDLNLTLPVLSEKDTELFARKMRKKEKERYFFLLDTLHQLSIKKNLTYFLGMGTLLGSYRHHDIVPWDDDLDLMIPVEHKAILAQEYKNITDQYFTPTTYNVAKISLKYGQKYLHGDGKLRYKYTFPFLDLFFYTVNKTHMLNYRHGDMRLDIIFPLNLRPLNKKLYYGPRDPHRYIATLGYSLDECYTGGYNHSGEYVRSQSDRATAPCSSLINKVPFVQHVRGPGGAWCQEVLSLGKKVLSTFARSKENITDC